MNKMINGYKNFGYAFKNTLPPLASELLSKKLQRFIKRKVKDSIKTFNTEKCNGDCKRLHN